ncbi:MAG: hypothetical protein EB015_21115 [Methylocystaceae bacterium]|nr:hypothetical protein [Methylocystaceae bacterium]
MIPYGRQSINSDDINAVISALSGDFLTTGPLVELFEHEIEKIRQRGWATAPNEILIGLNTLAAPIFGADGQLVAVIGIVDSIQFIDAMPSAEQIRRTLGAAQQISELLGYQSARAMQA